MEAQNMGFDSSGVLTLRIKPDWSAANRTLADCFLLLRDRLMNFPGIQYIAANAHVPMTTRPGGIDIDAHTARPEVNAESLGVGVNIVAGHYFEALGIPLLRGRTFTEQDTVNSERVVILSEQLTRLFWPGRDPIGELVTIRGQVHTVVGIVGDLRDSYDYDAAAKHYVAMTQQPTAINAMVLVLRSSLEPAALAGIVRREVFAIDSQSIVSDIRTMESIRESFVETRRSLSVMIGAFGVVALLLAAAGIYGVFGRAPDACLIRPQESNLLIVV